MASKLSTIILRLIVFSLVLLCIQELSGQSGVITGQISDKLTNEPIIGANVILKGTDRGTATDLDGKFELTDVQPGLYTIEITYLGYDPLVFNEIEVQSKRPTIINNAMTESGKLLEEVVVKAANFRKTAESPVSLRSIGVSEIKRNPGGNRDISRVIQSLPGVTSTASFRNDLIIRGGAPNENRFYIDEVETPAINHFATQGSSGGPAGLINVDFVREVDFYSGAFPASRSNALSSVFNFKFKDGRDDRIGMNATIGATDIGATLDGPIGEKTTFLVSARRSYLQFLFKAVGLPFLPTYTDFNAKVKYKINQKNEIYFIGLGANDDFELNRDANDSESKQYILDRLPINTQWNYTNGVVYKHYGDHGFTTVVLSRNMLNNNAIKYYNNDESSSDNLILDYNSREIENKLRIERTTKTASFEYAYGVNAEYAKYSTTTFNKIYTNAGSETIDYNSAIDMIKYGAFLTLNKNFIDEKLRMAVGVRMDGNNAASSMENPLKQLSPRISVSYIFAENWSVNFNTGIYYQVPPYTTIGYRSNNSLVNLDNGLKYIGVRHLVTGLEYNYNNFGRVTLEGYYKNYSHYPILLREDISLANLGGDFGVIGNQPVQSDGRGETYGLELMVQQKLYKGFYGIIAYTLGHSRFTNADNAFVPSSWDARHIVNMTLGKRFGKNWEIGAKYRYQSGLPGTPYANTSDLVINWQRNAGGILDYSRINSLRYQGGGTLDVRVDKKWFFKKWDINLYLDIQNVLGNAISKQVLILDRPLDAEGKPIGTGTIINPDAPLEMQRYALKYIDDSVGTTLPTIGLVISL